MIKQLIRIESQKCQQAGMDELSGVVIVEFAKVRDPEDCQCWMLRVKTVPTVRQEMALF